MSHKQLDILITKKGKEVLQRMTEIQKDMEINDADGGEAKSTNTNN